MAVKYAVGADADRLQGMPRSAQEGLFADALQVKEVLSATAPVMSPWHNGGAYLLAPVLAAGRSAGCLYAERTADAAVDEATALAAFRLLVQQVSLILIGAS